MYNSKTFRQNNEKPLAFESSFVNLKYYKSSYMAKQLFIFRFMSTQKKDLLID